MDAFPDIYKWSIHEIEGLFSDAERDLIIHAFKGFSIAASSAGDMLSARCRIIMDADDRKIEEIKRDEFLAKIGALPKSLVMILEIWASREAKKNETGEPHEHR